jgi:hypothetical protein
MTTGYSDKLLRQLAAYTQQHAGQAADGAWKDRDNILPSFRERFWAWFEGQKPRLNLHPQFHDLSSSQAMCFNLFFPLLHEGRADRRLLEAVGIAADTEFGGHFEKTLDAEESSSFDFYLEAASGRKIFFDLKLSEAGFGTCTDDERHRHELERYYQPRLEEHIDRKWLEPGAFFSQYEILRNVSYLGHFPDSGLVFIFPRANERLKDAEQTIKQIVSKSLAPRVAILYLEYLVERILASTSGDAALQEHFLAFREKYICW